MSDITDTIMKFERLMGHSHDELMEIGRHPTPRMNPNEMKTIAYVKYDSKTGKFTYTPTERYNSKVKSK